MIKRFNSFPYNKQVWVVSIHQLIDVDSSIEFSDEVCEFIDISGYDFNNVTELILGTGVHELNTQGDHTEYLQKTINNCHKKFPNLKNIYIFYTTVYFDESKLVSTCSITSIYLPYFLLRSTLTDLTQFTNWDIKDKRAIFLIGDIRNRLHKFPLLYYFWVNGSIDKLNYSLHNDHYGSDYFQDTHMGYVIRMINECFLSQYDLNSFEELYKNLSRYFDDDHDYITQAEPYSGLSIYTHYYPKDWNTAVCNLVVETTFFTLKNHLRRNYMNRQEEFFLSEKMWKPILSGKPFIVISENDSIYEQLEKMGFRTFLKYTKYPDKFNVSKEYDIPYVNEHIKICYERTISFLDNVGKYEDQILEDVILNTRKWKAVSKKAWHEVYTKCPPTFTMTKSDFCELFNNNVSPHGRFKDWAHK